MIEKGAEIERGVAVVKFVLSRNHNSFFSLRGWPAVKSPTGFLCEPRPCRGDLYARTCPFIMRVPCACQRGFR